MRYISLFSGVEAATLAWRPLGWEPVALSEIDPFACAVLEHRLPGVENLGDVRGIDWREEMEAHGRVDVVVGGSPCQSFSIAGNREGLDGESGLMWEYVRAVREVRPRWIVWENVPGALSSTHGEDFGCLLRELDVLGYGLAWRVLDAQFFGVPQRRRRLFVVGSLGDRRACDVLLEPEGLPWDTPTSREKRKELAGRTEVGARGRCWQITGNIINRQPKHGGHQLGVRDPEIEGAFTLTAADRHAVAIAANQREEVRYDGGDGSTIGAVPATRSGKQVQAVVEDGGLIRRLTPRECERLQGFPDDWTKVPYRGKPADECPDGPRYRAIGNSMAVPVMRWIGERIQEVCHEEDQVPVPEGD